MRLLLSLLLLIISCKYPDEYIEELSSIKEIYGIEIMLPSSSICISEEMQAQLFIILPSGEKKTAIPEEVSWASNNINIFSVSESGLITGNIIGTATITARFDKFSADKTLTIERAADYSKILLTEIFYDVIGSDTGKEFIELYNGNDYECEISGFMLIDGDPGSKPFILPGGSTINAFDNIIIAQSYDGFITQFGFPPDYSGFSFSLNNSGETVYFLNPDGEMLDHVFIEGGYSKSPADALWSSVELPAASEGNSINRINSIDTDSFEDWKDGPPDPGGH